MQKLTKKKMEMIRAHKINMTRRYFKIYRNLHRGNFSIQSYNDIKKGFRVTDRGSSMLLFNVDFRVSENGRQKVIKEKRKNVHAFVLPTSYSHLTGEVKTEHLREIYYNPYKYSSFVYKDTEEVAEDVSIMLAHDNKLYDATGNTLEDLAIY